MLKVNLTNCILFSALAYNNLNAHDSNLHILIYLYLYTHIHTYIYLHLHVLIISTADRGALLLPLCNSTFGEVEVPTVINKNERDFLI